MYSNLYYNQVFKIAFSLIFVLCLSTNLLAQDKERKIDEELAEAKDLILKDSRKCIFQGIEIYRKLLSDKRVKRGSIEEGIIHEHIGYADFRLDPELWDRYAYEKALSIYRKHSSKESKLREAKTLLLLGVGLNEPHISDIGREDAIKYLTRSLNIVKQLGGKNGRMKINILKVLGDHYAALGQYKLALKCDKQRLLISKNLNDIGEQSKVMADIAFNVGISDDKTLDYFQEGLELSKKSNDKESEIYVLVSLGKFYRQREKREESEKTYNEALNIAKEIKDITWKRTVYSEFMQLYKGVDDEKLNDYTKLYQKAEEELQIADCVISPRVGER